MTHFIRRQYLHVDLKGSEPDGFALQHRLADLYYTRLLPAIEKALDKCSVPGKLLVIDRLEIDAGTIDLNRIDQDLATSLVEALVPGIQYEAARNSAGQKDTSQDIFYREEEENTWEAFMYFLKNGFLPWSYKLPADKNLEEILAELLIDEFPHRNNTLPIARIAHTLTSTHQVKRLVLQFSEPFIKMLLEKISSGSSEEMESVTNDLKFKFLPPGEFNQVRKLILEKSILQASAGIHISKERISKLVLEELRSKPDLFLKVATVFDNEGAETGLADMNPFISGINTAEEISNKETTEGIYIENAGLVLLHPFLPRFFEALGISKESVILQPEKALVLLHYLTTGMKTAPEYELVLPKILCNIPLSSSLPLEIDIAVNEAEEASALLDAVIKHWEALRNTSRDGLRGTFLLRPGKLSLKNDGDWLLQVESQTYDILLNQLPWGITMIKLPWMEKMIWVEWNV
jgi:hypothetical protein